MQLIIKNIKTIIRCSKKNQTINDYIIKRYSIFEIVMQNDIKIY